MVLSDRAIRRLIEDGRIGIDPYDPGLMQPSSLDVRVDALFRVFRNSTAGVIDPGFDGHVTLELSNVANLPITIYPGMKIGQLSFVQMSEPAETPYGAGALGSKYQGQRGPTPSRYWQNFADPE